MGEVGNGDSSPDREPKEANWFAWGVNVAAAPVDPRACGVVRGGGMRVSVGREASDVCLGCGGAVAIEFRVCVGTFGLVVGDTCCGTDLAPVVDWTLRLPVFLR